MRDRNIKSLSYKVHRILKETQVKIFTVLDLAISWTGHQKRQWKQNYEVGLYQNQKCLGIKGHYQKTDGKRQSRNERKYLQITHLMRNSQQHTASALTPEAGVRLGYHHHRGVLLIWQGRVQGYGSFRKKTLCSSIYMQPLNEPSHYMLPNPASTVLQCQELPHIWTVYENKLVVESICWPMSRASPHLNSLWK